MGWKSLSGPMVGRLLVSAHDAPDAAGVISAAHAAGVNWVDKGTHSDIDFCLALSAANRPLSLQFRGERFVCFADFSALVSQHCTEGTPLRELLLRHLFSHQGLHSTGSTYRFSLARADEVHETLCSLQRTNLHLQSGAAFFEGIRECDRDPVEFPVSAVRGAMRHVGSGTLVFARDVAAALPTGGQALDH
jgi:hypothetical protein